MLYYIIVENRVVLDIFSYSLACNSNAVLMYEVKLSELVHESRDAACKTEIFHMVVTAWAQLAQVRSALAYSCLLYTSSLKLIIMIIAYEPYLDTSRIDRAFFFELAERFEEIIRLASSVKRACIYHSELFIVRHGSSIHSCKIFYIISVRYNNEVVAGYIIISYEAVSYTHLITTQARASCRTPARA